MSELDHQQAVDILLAWETERKGLGKRAPASPQRPNLLSLERVEQETGIPRYRYARQHQRLRKLLDEIVERLGGVELEWDRAAFATGEVHLQLCKALCMKRYEQDCAEAGEYFEAKRLDIERLFAILVKRSDAGLAAPARPALEALREAIAHKEIRDGHRLASYVDTALEIVTSEEQRAALPDNFSDRLCLVTGRAGLSRTQAAIMIDVVQGTFNSWCSGAKQPDRSAWPKISALEALLELDPGTLVDLITPGRLGVGRIGRDLFPETLRGEDHARFRSEISRQMPDDFFERPIREQMQMLSQKAEQLQAAARKSQAWYDLRHDVYRLADFSPALESEWQALVAFKKGRTNLLTDSGGPVLAHNLWRKPSTITSYHDRIAGYFGFLVNHAPEAFRIAREEASLLQLANTGAILAFLRFKEQRSADYTGEGRLTPTDIDLITLAASLLSPLDGFLRFEPGYRAPLLAWRSTMMPGDDLPTSERTGRDHQEICNRLLDDLKRLENSFRGRTSNSAEHRARLEPLLSMPTPLMAFYDRLVLFQTEMQRLDPGRIGYWRAVRSAALLHILAQFPARRSMLVALDYRPDNSGHLRFENGRWFLRVPVETFKNDQAERFAGMTEEQIELDDVHGAYEIIGAYVNKARGHLLRGARSDALFVSTRKNPRYSPQVLDNLFQALIARLFGPGAGVDLHLPGFKTMTIHGMRDLVATATLKASGSYQTAADAILDSESTVRRAYARYKPSDRVQALKDAVRRARGDNDGDDDGL